MTQLTFLHPAHAAADPIEQPDDEDEPGQRPMSPAQRRAWLRGELHYQLQYLRIAERDLRDRTAIVTRLQVRLGALERERAGGRHAGT